MVGSAASDSAAAGGMAAAETAAAVRAAGSPATGLAATSEAVIVVVSATAGVLEGGDEGIDIRKSVIANSGQT